MIVAGACIGLGAAMVVTRLLHLLLAQTMAGSTLFKNPERDIRRYTVLGAAFFFVGAPLLGGAAVAVGA